MDRFRDGEVVVCTDVKGQTFKGKVTGPTYLEDYVYPGYWVEVEVGLELTFTPAQMIKENLGLFLFRFP